MKFTNLTKVVGSLVMAAALFTSCEKTMTVDLNTQSYKDATANYVNQSELKGTWESVKESDSFTLTINDATISLKIKYDGYDKGDTYTYEATDATYTYSFANQSIICCADDATLKLYDDSEGKTKTIEEYDNVPDLLEFYKIGTKMVFTFGSETYTCEK